MVFVSNLLIPQRLVGQPSPRGEYRCDSTISNLFYHSIHGDTICSIITQMPWTDNASGQRSGRWPRVRKLFALTR